VRARCQVIAGTILNRLKTLMFMSQIEFDSRRG